MRKWNVVEDGYHREVHLVDSKGRVVGVVRGSYYETNGWYSHAEEPSETVRMGRYTTLARAKTAVDDYWKSKEASDDK